MNTAQEDRMWAYYSRLRGVMSVDQMITGAMLVAETKAENKGKELNKEEAYEAMLIVSGKMREVNPFKGADDFYQAYLQVDENPDWEKLLYQSIEYERYGSLLVPSPLMKEMTEHIEGATTVLIAEGEKFVPNLRSTVDAHLDCNFTITTQNMLYAKVLSRIFEGYDNVTIQETNIYTYGFLNEKFDRILSVPIFGGRDLAEDAENFMCRETDMVALENLLLHLSAVGELVIVLPGRITFAGGHVNDLRKFVTQMYKLEMIAELPDGIFQNTGIKTYLITVAAGRTEDVVIRKYEAVDRKTKRGPVEKMTISEDTFAMQEEIEENGDWSIDKLFTQQNEDYMRYQASDLRKIPLGEVAEIFRGKAVSRKDQTGDIGVVNISNIGQYDIDYNGLDKIDEEERKVQNYILQEGDVVLPARGTAIRSAVFHEQTYPCIASSNLIVIRPNQKKLNSTFLKIFIDSPIGNNMISSLQQGMTVMNISYKDLKVLEVPFPSIEEQGQIAKEYEDSYKQYTESISEAEKQWKDTLDKLQKF
jgi:type I restriction enzyme M protein